MLCVRSAQVFLINIIHLDLAGMFLRGEKHTLVVCSQGPLSKKKKTLYFRIKPEMVLNIKSLKLLY